MPDIDQFYVVDGRTVGSVLESDRQMIIELVQKTYQSHESGQTNNPDSYFLRFPDDPSARIIALPSSIKSDVEISGIKWIASYPENLRQNKQRASAVMILNDYQTGYPIACLEASQISSARTAASAAIAARTALKSLGHIKKLSVIGAGLIARTTLTYLNDLGCLPEAILVHDKDSKSSDLFVDYYNHSFAGVASSCDDLEETIRHGQIVILATTVAKPYITDPKLFSTGQLTLNISLRDVSPDVVLNSYNFFDDIEHCMKANTSAHLTEQKVGNRNFAHTTLGKLLLGKETVPNDKPFLFSPFGLGVLDLVVAIHVLNASVENGSAILIENFLPSMTRW